MPLFLAPGIHHPCSLARQHVTLRSYKFIGTSPILIFRRSYRLANINITKPLFTYSCDRTLFFGARTPWIFLLFRVDYPISLLSQFCMERHCTKVHCDLVNFQTPGRKPAQKRKLNPASACFIFKHRLVKFSALNARCARNAKRRIMQSLHLYSKNYVNASCNLCQRNGIKFM